MKDYSQHGQQKTLLSTLKDFSPGFFIEIGANNGEKGSNCRALAVQGWRGACIEACEKTYKSLRKLYKNNSAINTIHAAVTSFNGKIEFYRGGPLDEFLNGGGGLNSIHADFIQQVKKDNPGYIFEKTVVPAMTLNRIWENEGSPTINFLCIDTEGHDFEILKSTNLRKIRPDYIMFENNKTIDGVRTGPNIKKLLNENGFKPYHEWIGEEIWKKDS